jgi:hypothetical protein
MLLCPASTHQNFLCRTHDQASSAFNKMSVTEAAPWYEQQSNWIFFLHIRSILHAAKDSFLKRVPIAELAQDMKIARVFPLFESVPLTRQNQNLHPISSRQCGNDFNRD